MSASVTVQAEEGNLPILLLYIGESFFLPKILKEFVQKTKIILVSDQKIDETFRPHVFHLNKSSSYMVTKVEDHINYSLIFLDEEKDKKILEYLIDKINKDNAKTTVIVPVDKAYRFYDLLKKLIQKNYIQVLFLGDIFDRSNSSFQNDTSKIIRNAITKKEVALSGDDLFPIYPLSETDFFTGINLSLFGETGKENIFYFFYNHPQTIISAVHLLKRVETDLAITYMEEKRGNVRKSFEVLENEIIQNLGKKAVFLDEYFQGFEKSVSAESEKKPQSVMQVLRNSHLPKLVKDKGKIGIKVYLAGIGLYLLLNLLLITVGYVSIRQAAFSVESGDYQTAEQQMHRGVTSIQLTTPLINFISSVVSPLNFLIKIDEKKVQLANMEDVFTVINGLLSEKNSFTFSNPPSLEELTALYSNLNYLYFQTNSFSQNNKTNHLRQVLSRFLPLLDLASVAPEVLGYTHDKTYLLLFQNNAELRPTGGFIGSVGELTLSKGKIANLTIHDVYDVDGQLKNHVEPYFIIRRYLQPHLYLRDSNFNPDFQETASTSAQLYKLSTGKEVDGVISIDFEVLDQIIKMIGPITLSEYNKTLTKDNALTYIQNTIEDNFFPGSTEKKDILSSIMNKLIFMLENNSKDQYKILAILPTLLEQKHIEFAFRDAHVQKIFTLLNFGGTFLDERERLSGNIYDSLAINEANIGVNKANMYVKRRVVENVTLSNNRQDTTVMLELGNTNKTMTYKSYLRFFVPAGSTLTSLVIDDKKQELVPAVTDPVKYEAKNFTPPKGLEVDTSTTDGLTGSGFIVTVKPNSIQKIEANFTRQIGTLAPLFTYSLLYFKQPGTDTYPLQVFVHYPQGYHAKQIADAVTSNGQEVITKEVDRDLEFTIPITNISQ